MEVVKKYSVSLAKAEQGLVDFVFYPGTVDLREASPPSDNYFHMGVG